MIDEAISRLRSELHLVGLQSHPIDCDAEGAQDARACSDERSEVPDSEPTPAPSPGTAMNARSGVAGAIIALAREDGVVTIEVIERLLNGSKFFRLVYVPGRDGGDDPSVLAVRGVELLRDLHMDVERNRALAAATPAPAVVETEPAVPRKEPGPWRLGAAAGLLQGRDGLGPRVAPVLSVARAFGPRWSAVVLASGPYLEQLSLSPDYTSTHQELATLGLRGALPTAGRLHLFGELSAGVLHLVANGHSDDTTAILRQRSLWSALLGAGAGAGFSLTRFIEIVAQADVLLALPAGRITIRDTTVGTAGEPSGLFQLGLWAALP